MRDATGAHGGPPALIGLEHSDGAVTGVFTGVPYCGGAFPPTSSVVALVELDAVPTAVRSRIQNERSDCPMHLPRHYRTQPTPRGR